jgi:hypothetical protein
MRLQAAGHRHAAGNRASRTQTVSAALPVFKPEDHAPRQDGERQVAPEEQAVQIPGKDNEGASERPRHGLRQLHGFVTFGKWAFRFRPIRCTRPQSLSDLLARAAAQVQTTSVAMKQHGIRNACARDVSTGGGCEHDIGRSWRRPGVRFLSPTTANRAPGRTRSRGEPPGEPIYRYMGGGPDKATGAKCALQRQFPLCRA